MAGYLAYRPTGYYSVDTLSLLASLVECLSEDDEFQQSDIDAAKALLKDLTVLYGTLFASESTGIGLQAGLQKAFSAVSGRSERWSSIIEKAKLSLADRRGVGHSILEPEAWKKAVGNLLKLLLELVSGKCEQLPVESVWENLLQYVDARRSSSSQLAVSAISAWDPQGQLKLPLEASHIGNFTLTLRFNQLVDVNTVSIVLEKSAGMRTLTLLLERVDQSSGEVVRESLPADLLLQSGGFRVSCSWVCSISLICNSSIKPIKLLSLGVYGTRSIATQLPPPVPLSWRVEAASSWVLLDGCIAMDAMLTSLMYSLIPDPALLSFFLSGLRRVMHLRGEAQFQAITCLVDLFLQAPAPLAAWVSERLSALHNVRERQTWAVDEERYEAIIATVAREMEAIVQGQLEGVFDLDGASESLLIPQAQAEARDVWGGVDWKSRTSWNDATDWRQRRCKVDTVTAGDLEPRDEPYRVVIRGLLVSERSWKETDRVLPTGPPIAGQEVYGIYEISIPKRHALGSTTGCVLSAFQEVTEGCFYRLVAECRGHEASQSAPDRPRDQTVQPWSFKGRPVLHTSGYNTTPQEAVFNAAMFAYEVLKGQHLVVARIWACAGKPFAFVGDLAGLDRRGASTALLMDGLLKTTDFDVFCHSLGCAVIARALLLLRPEKGTGSLRNIIFAASPTEAGTIHGAVEQVHYKFGLVGLSVCRAVRYAYPRDIVVGTWREFTDFFLDFATLKDGDSLEVLSSIVETVDVSAVNPSIPGHGYHKGSYPVIFDTSAVLEGKGREKEVRRRVHTGSDLLLFELLGEADATPKGIK